MAARLGVVVRRVAKQLTTIFSTIAGAVALTPVPVADVYILIILQSLLVCLIASLGGLELSLENAKEFIFGLGGVIGAGFTFRVIAQQSSKFVNSLWPGVGSAVSSSIAAAGTHAIGRAAIMYYIDGKSIDEVSEKFKEMRKEKRKELEFD